MWDHGIVNFDLEPVSPVQLKAMTDATYPSGPDGEGQYVEGHVGLGHRRLAIIDTSASGKQPIQSVDKRFTITYNGEVYNFRELRVELESLGFQFHSPDRFRSGIKCIYCLERESVRWL